MRMKLSDFNYELPKELVAEYPNKTRDEAKLMVIDRKDYSILHRQCKDMIEYFDENDVIVCCAGMDGALPSVLAGLVPQPIIPVPIKISVIPLCEYVNFP